MAINFDKLPAYIRQEINVPKTSVVKGKKGNAVNAVAEQHPVEIGGANQDLG